MNVGNWEQSVNRVVKDTSSHQAHVRDGGDRCETVSMTGKLSRRLKGDKVLLKKEQAEQGQEAVKCDGQFS